MDILSHGLWAYLLFHKKTYKWKAVLFSVLPDLISFAPFLLTEIIYHGFKSGKPPLEIIPNYVFIAYNFTHSLVIFALVSLTIFFILKKFYWPLLGWGLHVITDIFTHTREYFPTPFLYPLSDLKLSVISWGNPIFLIINYTLLVGLYAYFIIYKRKKARK